MTKDNTEVAIFAGGCFWGVQELIRKHSGVLNTKVGYCGGDIKNPSYEQIKQSETNHKEAVYIIYKPQITSYTELLKLFFSLHNPTTQDQQGNDIGKQYASAIFYCNKKQKQQAEEYIALLTKQMIYKNPIVTQIIPYSVFYDAEEFHQDYLQKNPQGYNCHFIRKEWIAK